MRELSAKLTEGEIFNSQIYVFACTSKITVNVQITDSKNRKLHALQILCTNIVFFYLFRGVVTTAIKLNDQSNACAVEVHYVITNRFLPLEPYWVTS